MAVDTENKRRLISHVLPVPDGSIGAVDRAHVLWLFSNYLILVIDVAVSDSAAYGLAVADAAAYGLALTNAAGYGLAVVDVAAYGLAASDDAAYDLAVSDASRSA